MIITGGPLGETLTGTSGDDVIDGGGGADTMIGLAGNDTYFVDDPADRVIEAVDGGSDTVFTSVSFTLAAGQEIEFLRVRGSTALPVLTGNELANYLIGAAGSDILRGNEGDDSLDGDLGADVMIGGSGNDTFYVDNVGDQVIELAGGGSDTVLSSINYALSANQEVEVLQAQGPSGLTLAGNARDNDLIGASGDDTLSGGGGDDRLDGAAGTDTMAGGSGNDIYYVDTAGDRVIEAAGAGSDTVHTSVDFSLAAGQEIETLRVLGSAGLSLAGNELANSLIGGSGADTLDGRLGADLMAGGGGNDVYHVDNAGDRTIEAADEGSDNVYASVDYALEAGQEIEFLRVYGSAGLALTGNELANYLIGGSADDALAGGAGDDRLDGGAGGDTMAGGSGNDFYYVDNAGDRTIEVSGGGSDNVYASVDYALEAGQEIEFLRVYGSAGLALTGNELANYLLGGSGDDALAGGDGNDTLDGRLGADLMAGGSGNDVYVVDNAGDRVVEAAGEGSDTVYTGVSFTLEAGQEIESLQVYGSTAGLTLAGNELANILNGGAGDDTLIGNQGGDRFVGGAGNDAFYGNSTTSKIDDRSDIADYSAPATGLTQGIVVDWAQGIVTGQAGVIDTDRLIGVEGVFGTQLDDVFDATDFTTASQAAGDNAVDSTPYQLVRGGGGNDTIIGNGQTEVDYRDATSSVTVTLTAPGTGEVTGGGVGKDTLQGGVIRYIGSSYDDTFNGSSAQDIFDGGPGGNDVFHGGGGADQVEYDGYADAFAVDLAAGTMVGRFSGSVIGYQTLDSIEQIRGSEGDDIYDATGFSGSSTNKGSLGTYNQFEGQGGADTVTGNGNTNLLYASATGGIVATVTGSGSGTVAATYGSDTATDSFTDVYWITGSNFGDSMLGGAGNERFEGRGGSDVLNGGNGDDVLSGGAGLDDLTGGGGNDIFLFDQPLEDDPVEAMAQSDVLQDFAPGSDTLQLDHNSFSGFALGQLAATDFSSSGPTRGDGPQILYDQSSGYLFYDPDRTGDASAIAFARIANGATLSASSFVVV